MSAALQKRLATLKLEVVKCRTSPLMAQHGPPYVNVAFQREEIELEGGGVPPLVCWEALSHVRTSSFFFIFSCYLRMTALGRIGVCK